MTVVPTDTCTVVNMLEIKSIAKTLTRAVAPEQAGREGVDFGITNEVGAEILNQFKPFPKDRMNVNFTLKVYVKFSPIPDETHEFHEACHSVTLIVLVNSHQR